MDPGLHRLQKSDVPKACAVLTEAFAHDPFYAYIMGNAGYDPSLPELFHLFTLEYGIAYGSVFAPGPGIEGVAIWLPPGSTHISTWRSLVRGLPILRKARPPKTVRRGALLARLMKYGSFAEKIHRRHAPFPHWYLMVLGVADAHRGTGVASRLLRPVLDRIDAEGLPCYLETHNPANPPIYEHFGFTVKEVRSLPGSERSHWAMLRPPAKGDR